MGYAWRTLKHVVNRNGSSVWLSLYQGSFSLSSISMSTTSRDAPVRASRTACVLPVGETYPKMSTPAGLRGPATPSPFVRFRSTYFSHCLLAFLGCSLCQPQGPQTRQRIRRVSNQDRRFSMLRLSECKQPWWAPSSVACRTHWGPTPKARPDSFRGRAGPSVSSVRFTDLFPSHNQ